MRKKLLVLGSIFLFINIFFFSNWLQKTHFVVFNQVSEDRILRVKKHLTESKELDFTALLCNEVRLPFDDTTNTFYVSLDMDSTQWEELRFSSGQKEYEILFARDITQNDKQNVIAEGKKFDFLVYDQNFWSTYYIVFTGLPIIDLSTNEGFNAGEEITGSAIFYDTDFTLHGIKRSDYKGHVRGNTSRMFPKKGYKLNLIATNNQGEEEKNKLSLFDLRKDDDWILYAIYNDDTKIRDKLSMEVWDKLGANAISENSYYGPRMTYVEVFADNRYCGLYGLMEPVDAKQLDLGERDYSYKRKNPGGVFDKYIVFAEADSTAEIEGFELKAGKISEDSWMPMANLSAYLTSSEEEKREKQQDIINEDSVLRAWLFLQIITGHDHTAKNMFYVAKYDHDLKYKYQFYFAPWDMDLTWGNVSVGEVNPLYTDFEMETVDDRVYWETADWLIDMDYHGAKEKVQKLYQELRATVLNDHAVEKMILELDAEIRNSGAFARDEARWPEGAHAKDCSTLLEYAKERLSCLDKAIENFEYFDQ